jgi:glycosyltransferase involved in cell wall biosynthesis
MERNPLIVSVVLSFYNESAVIPELIRRLRAVFSLLVERGWVDTYELIFVNDNSTDNSLELLKNELSNGDIVIINMSRNFGVSECVVAGMNYAIGDAVIYMDSDLQDPPEVIVNMLESWRNNPDADVVYTTRRSRADEHWMKMLITKIGYRFINAISEIELKVDSGDFKLLSRRVVKHLINLKEDRPYMRGLVSWVGFKQVQVYYDRDGRFDGSNNTKMRVLSKKVIYYWLDRALISFSDAPLKLMLFFGLGLSFISLLYILVVIAQKFLNLSVPGWAAIMSSILFLGGIQIMMLGFIGLYIGSIFKETKKRPLYIIKDILKKDHVLNQ